VDRTVKSGGAVPSASRVVTAAEKHLGGRELTVVKVDMPLSTTLKTGRREADAAFSTAGYSVVDPHHKVHTCGLTEGFAQRMVHALAYT
jgi:hypothetical protein